jgi:peptide chain release factor subunit 1
VIGAADVSRLLSLRAPDHGIISVYLTVPLDPGQRRAMTAHLDDAVAAASQRDGGAGAWARARRAEVPAIRRLLGSRGPEWPGHSVAIFACSALGLLETVPLRGQVAERAVLGSRPYVRPLLAEVQRCASYLVAVVDRRHGWLFRVSGDGIEPGEQVESPTVASRRFGGWHGFQSYRNDQRSRTLARQHYAAVAAALTAATGGAAATGTAPAGGGPAGGGAAGGGVAGGGAAGGGCEPIVLGGNEAVTREVLAALPAVLRNRVAGSFAADPHAMTPARVRVLADDVVGRWEDSRERRLAATLAEQPPGPMTAIGLDACVHAVNQHAVQLLMVPGDTMQPGVSCGDCGTLAVAGATCPACGAATEPVEDVIEELAVKVTQDGGSVQAVRGATALRQIAARRRFPALA